MNRTGELLIVTAVPAEAAAVRAGLGAAATVLPVGVGSATAAAGTARLLALAEAAGRPYRAVICAGIAGGFADRVAVGGIVLATSSIGADLGAETPDGFQPLDRLGMSPADLGGALHIPADPALLAAVRAGLPQAVVGDVLTVNTVTGSDATAERHRKAYPDAVAEAMEGHGVGLAAARAAVPFLEVRTIANPVGPRDRAAWRLDAAFAALGTVAGVLGTVAATDALGGTGES